MLIAQRLEIGSVPVIATFECNGSIQRIDNQDEDSLVDDLMETIGYTVDIHQYPELKNIGGKRKCIKYHSEKKAVAQLWDQNVMKIDISVNLFLFNAQDMSMENYSLHSDKKHIY